MNQKSFCCKTTLNLIHPHEKKSRPPAGSGPAQLIRAVLAQEVYLAVKALEERGTPLSELLVDPLDADPVGTLTKL